MNAAHRRTAFAIFSLAVLAAGVPILRDLYYLSRDNDTASHQIIVPLVTLGLIYQRRDFIFASTRPDRIRGLVLILGGCALALGARPHAETRLTMAVAGLVFTWIGGFLFFWGPDAFRRALFPLCFLGFAIPIPNTLLQGATHILKAGSAELVAGLFTLTQTPYHRAGFVFNLPEFAIEIADECSGIRSSIALVLTALLVGDQLLQTSWKKALIVLAVGPLAIVKNAIRIVGLSLLATRVDTSFLTGQLHHEGGIVFFLLTLAVLTPLLAFLRHSETTLVKDAR